MSNFSLDSIRDAAEAKYGSIDIVFGEHTAVLLNPLRLSKAKRTELVNLQTEMEAEGSDQEECLTKGLRLVCATEGQADRLLDAIGGDLAVLAEVFDTYGKGTQAGEASASAA